MLVVIGMGSLGILLGAWIALSKSAVVLTVLPLMFGILGSAGGYSIWKLDSSRPADRRRLRLIGASLTAISITCFIAMGSILLLRPTLSTLFRPVPVTVTRLKNPLSALLLREKLSRIGASNAEIQAVLNKYLDSDVDDTSRLAHLRDAATKFATAYEKSVETSKLSPQAPQLSHALPMPIDDVSGEKTVDATDPADAIDPLDPAESANSAPPLIAEERIPYQLRQVYELSQAIVAAVDAIGLNEPGFDKALVSSLLREAISSSGAGLSGFSDKEVANHGDLLRAWLVLVGAIGVEQQSFIGNAEMASLDKLIESPNPGKRDFADMEIGAAVMGFGSY